MFIAGTYMINSGLFVIVKPHGSKGHSQDLYHSDKPIISAVCQVLWYYIICICDFYADSIINANSKS